MKIVSILAKAALAVLLSQGVHAPSRAQVPDTPRTMEHPAVTAERDAQLVTPAAKAPSWGPSLYPAPAGEAATEPDAARAKRPARADLEVGAPAAQALPVTRPPKQARTPRRAVDQVLTPTTRIVGSAATVKAMPGYGPAQGITAPAPAAPAQRGTVPATCAGSGCVDASGQRLGTGVGNAVVTPQGQLCTRGVVGVQCF